MALLGLWIHYISCHLDAQHQSTPLLGDPSRQPELQTCSISNWSSPNIGDIPRKWQCFMGNIYIYILYCIINIRTYIIIYYRIPQNMGHPNPKSTQLSSHTAGFKCSLHIARVIPCAGNGFNIRQPIKESGSTSWLILFRHVQAVLCFFDGRCRSNSFFKGIIVRSCAKLSSGLDPNGPKPSLFNLGLSKCWVPPWLLGLSENVNVHPQKPLADDHFPFRQ